MKNLIKSKKTWIAFVVVFLSGIAIGLVVGMAVKETPEKKKKQKHQSMMKIRLLRHMSEKLQLTPDQKKNVDTILTAMTKNISALQTEQRPKIQSIIEDAFSEIGNILTEDQKTKMLTFQKRMSRLRRKHHERKKRGNGKIGSLQRREGGEKFRQQDGDRFFGGKDKKNKNFEKHQRRPTMSPKHREENRPRRHWDGEQLNRKPGEKTPVPSTGREYIDRRRSPMPVPEAN